ncbi:prohead protease/major capsid protein fusion protein [Paenirhodobacter populi]|uniref:Peptidase U35 n=1 Tax=Paenirhodobacter populi TaxID=2306993 RepID=A0A443JD80_9RHOB|nr:prohead protease/major capsid protein fusion protein [Sinirhodobacter populi]RWR18517.1 peptidase U35 [Sinirhodobacter populi]
MTLHLRAAAPAVSSVNLEARTVEAIASTGAEVRRSGFTERLDLAGADLSRLIGAPVLDAHRASSTKDQLGVVDAAEVRPEGLWVRLRFRSNDAARAVLADIADGTLRGLSIGYSVETWTETRRGKDRIRTAAKWQPIEISIVPVPADPAAGFRSEDIPMPETQENHDAGTMTRAQINAEIRSIAATASLDQAWTDAQIDAETTVEAARAAAFEAMRQRGAEQNVRTTRAHVGFSHDDPAVIATRAGEALFARSHPEHQLSPESRQFAYASFIDLARDSLRRSGVSLTGLAAEGIITRALHVNGDFGLILGDAVGRNLRQSYQSGPAGVRQAARQSTVRDFRPKSKVGLGSAPNLIHVPEAGEFPHGTMTETGEKYAAQTFGRIFGISRQALVNDDLGAFSALPKLMGEAARDFENAYLANMVSSNPAMADGMPVFDATRNNADTDDDLWQVIANAITAGSADTTVKNLAFTALAAIRTAMRLRKGPGGQFIDAAPSYVLVHPLFENIFERMISNLRGSLYGAPNAFPADLKLLVDPRLPSNAWYFAADPSKVEGLEYSYLEGAPGPQIETRTGFEIDGVQTKVRLDFGAGWVDWRGWHRLIISPTELPVSDSDMIFGLLAGTED